MPKGTSKQPSLTAMRNDSLDDVTRRSEERSLMALLDVQDWLTLCQSMAFQLIHRAGYTTKKLAYMYGVCGT